MSPSSDKPLTYAEAGVDIERGERLVARIRSSARSTHRDGVLAGIGGFGALFELPLDRYRRPVLVSGTDGVGTKLRLAIECARHGTVGVDLVAMCANDVLTLGAEPLFFLDYYATARLDEDVAAAVVEGIADGCRQAGAALIGGETAEMPGMYAPGDYDLAGFCVGVVERDRVLDARHVRVGDRLLGLASSGPHSNGFSLIRRVLERCPGALESPFDGGRSLADVLLEPTRIYVASLLGALQASRAIRGLAHITGGGLVENVPRVLDIGQRARIDPRAWPRPAVFDWLAEAGRIEPKEMLRVFNCGIGMVVVSDAQHADAVSAYLTDAGETVYAIGEVEAGDGPPRVVLD